MAQRNTRELLRTPHSAGPSRALKKIHQNVTSQSKRFIQNSFKTRNIQNPAHVSCSNQIKPQKFKYSSRSHLIADWTHRWVVTQPPNSASSPKLQLKVTTFINAYPALQRLYANLIWFENEFQISTVIPSFDLSKSPVSATLNWVDAVGENWVMVIENPFLSHFLPPLLFYDPITSTRVKK